MYTNGLTMRSLHGSLLSLLAVFCFTFFVSACSDDDDDNPVTNNNNEEQPSDTLQQEAVLDSMDFICKKGEMKIYGKLYKKVSIGKKAPAVILSHSSSLTHAAMADYARAIANKGMVAYCFDFCGGSSESKSDGNTDSMTVFTEVDDLKAVLSAVRQMDIVDNDSIFLLGSSQGGLVSALVAEECAKEVSGLILFYPACNIPDMVKQFGDLFNQWGSGDWGNLGDWGNMGSWGDLGDMNGMLGMMSMSELYISTIKDFDVWSNIGTFPHPVTILHGTSDIIVPISYSEKAVGLYPQATLHKIDGANHGFNAANLGSMGSMMGVGADYDGVVLPLVFRALNR